MTTNQDSAGKMREEILTDARRESMEIVNHARQESEAILTRASTEADHARQELLDHTRAEAARQSSLILATVPVETGRLRAARIEALLNSVYEEVRQRLLTHEGFEYRETVIDLAAHAIRQMTGDSFVVKLSEEDRPILSDDLADEIVHRAGKPVRIAISYGSDNTGGGVVVEDAESCQIWDNRLVKRLDRLWPELRRQIAMDASFVPKTGSGGDDS